MRERRLVRFSRRFEDATTRGYVLDVGSKFFRLLLVSDRIRYDGYECFRINDISGLRPDPYVDFVESALKKRKDRKPARAGINMQSTGKLLETASRKYPLVTIHLEGTNPDVCHIGKVRSIGNGKVSLLEISPSAQWDSELSVYKLKDITRINFGGDYEDALLAVGGDAKDA